MTITISEKIISPLFVAYTRHNIIKDIKKHKWIFLKFENKTNT